MKKLFRSSLNFSKKCGRRFRWLNTAGYRKGQRMKIIFVLLLFEGAAFAADTVNTATTARAPAAVSNAKATVNSATTPLSRNYPGGRDEDDLKVQEALVPPTVKTDRHQVEAKVLK